MTFVQKVDAQTNPHFGKRPEERTWQERIHNGIVIIDKPAGPTSHQVSAYVQQILRIDKAGHSGTLDPNVTGVLATGLGEATKVVQHLLTSGKTYICILHLHKAVPEYEVRKVAQQFIGKINQMPPVKSAVKRQLRERTIYSFDIKEIEGQDVLFEVSCQAGTYVRKLCHDLGRALGVGGHMAALRRTRVAHFDERESVTLQTLKDAYVYATQGKPEQLQAMILPVEQGVAHMKRIVVLDSAINAITHGVQLKVPGIAGYDDTIVQGETVAVYSLKGELVCVGEARLDAHRLAGNSGLAVKTSRVYLPADLYPRMQ